jgi:hypothetical protein
MQQEPCNTEYAVCEPHLAIRIMRHATCKFLNALGNTQYPESNMQSTIRNPQSAIRNMQSDPE